MIHEENPKKSSPFLSFSMATTSSSSSKPPLSPLFTPIQEGNEEDEHRCRSPVREYKHRPTPLHRCSENGSAKNRPESDGEDGRGVLCNKCRPSSRERISMVPLDGRNSTASPNGIFKTVFSHLVRKSPRLSDDGSSSSTTSSALVPEQWKAAVAELSQKLVQATKKKDDAVLEASRLKNSMAELEKKLDKLEIYCRDLKSGLEICSNHPRPHLTFQCLKTGDQERVIQRFLVSVSEARSSIRVLTRSIAVHLRQMAAGKTHDRISQLLHPYDVKLSLSKNSRVGPLYIEALLNRAFFEDFETVRFQKSSCNPVLNPLDRCAANFAAVNRLQGLKWEEVLSKGTRFFSEDFSRFCDRKMSEVMALLAWNRAWPEPLLQAFFGASKAVWLVHLLANSVHPALPIFRVDEKNRFDPVYMEDKGGDRARKLVPATVRIMLTPGFYVYDNVVKCKVLCRYNNGSGGCNTDDVVDDSNALTTPSPAVVVGTKVLMMNP